MLFGRSGRNEKNVREHDKVPPHTAALETDDASTPTAFGVEGLAPGTYYIVEWNAKNK